MHSDWRQITVLCLLMIWSSCIIWMSASSGKIQSTLIWDKTKCATKTLSSLTVSTGLSYCVLVLLSIQKNSYVQAFIFGLANSKFCQSSLTCRAQIHQGSKMSWFHIKLKCNDWLRKARVFPAKWFYWEYP